MLDFNTAKYCLYLCDYKTHDIHYGTLLTVHQLKKTTSNFPPETFIIYLITDEKDETFNDDILAFVLQ